MLTADRTIAASIMALSIYFMWHATVLPIGWVEGEGPGGGAFPFWLSAIMLLAAGGIFIRSFQADHQMTSEDGRFFDRTTITSVASVAGALIACIVAMPYLGAYIALPLFMFWYLKMFGGHGWVLTLSLCLTTPVFLFFFFEVTLKILLPKGWTEPWFFPLYAAFF
ncbi:tripartite tricarboxylate transporter TctB family protein [Litoreibacter ponti]|uniref:Tripartite tricarboxylate transporter TctB family protein n=1 Tax=Litoreibacter ponti TaxID=1510457 RepID=A0A2T6BDU1_9RHOB|nr:tripartite tricarboxylate transporter TctB family protein [Litoreibacter ponti]PTX54239.1 tripartite tricarboxylate transporter TctB family protein [Litoreibacter ponti]